MYVFHIRDGKGTIILNGESFANKQGLEKILKRYGIPYQVEEIR